MNPLSLGQITNFAAGSLAAGSAETAITRISTDSRTLQPGDLFVPLRGDNFDGHEFVPQAIERGAAGAMVEENWNGTTPGSFALIRVADTLVGYQTLAAN